MKRTVFRIVALASLFALVLPTISTATGSGPVMPSLGPADGVYDEFVYLPLVGRNTSSSLPPIIPDTTNVLDAATGQHLTSVSADGSTFTFDQSTPAL
jgi:hypothetical protein